MLIILIIGLLLLLNKFLTTSTKDKEKLSAYECGFVPVIGQNRYRFEIIYYLIGLLFLGFDIEIGLLVPVLTIELSYLNYWLSIIFLVLLTIGFIYEFKIKALNIKIDITLKG